MHILFVCLGNSFRSVIAEKLTEERLAGVDAQSAGLDPADEVTEKAADMLRNHLEIDELEVQPAPVTQELVDWAGLVVVMEEYMLQRLQDEFDMEHTATEVWEIEDSPPEAPHQVFTRIEEKIAAMEPEELKYMLGE